MVFRILVLDLSLEFLFLLSFLVFSFLSCRCAIQEPLSTTIEIALFTKGLRHFIRSSTITPARFVRTIFSVGKVETMAKMNFYRHHFDGDIV